MKVRDLVDLLERVYDARESIVEAERAVSHGGSQQTMDWKNDVLKKAKRAYEELLDEDLP